MNKAARIAVLPAVATYTLAAMAFNKSAGVLGLSWRLPGGGFSFPWVSGQGGGRDRYDYKSIVGDGRNNSIVSATVAWVTRTFPEAPLAVSIHISDDEEDKAQPNHPLAKLLKRPNPCYSALLLWAATVADLIITGNAYWLIQRGAYLQPATLWWVPSYLIEPRYPRDGSVWISHYDYRPAGYPIPVDPDDVVHFKTGMDPMNMRKGLSALGAQLREVFTDDEAGAFTATILRNLGLPGLVLSPTDPRGLTQKQTEALKQNLIDKFSGERRGEPFVSTGGLNVDVIGWSPQQMDVKSIRSIPEERISAAIGVPAVIVGLGAGLAQATYANVMTLRRIAWESCIIPLHRVIEASIEERLVPEFGDPDVLRVWFDRSQVAALQEDRSAIFKDASTAVNAGWLMVGQALEMAKFPHAPEDNYYLRSGLVTAVPGDGFEPREIPTVPAAGASNMDVKPPQPTPAQLLPFRDPNAPKPDAVPELAAASLNGRH